MSDRTETPTTRTAIDPREPMHIRAEMARAGLAPDSLRCHDDPERGWVDPLDDDESRTEVRRFMFALWRGCLAAEAEASSGSIDREDSDHE